MDLENKSLKHKVERANQVIVFSYVYVLVYWALVLSIDAGIVFVELASQVVESYAKHGISFAIAIAVHIAIFPAFGIVGVFIKKQKRKDIALLALALIVTIVLFVYSSKAALLAAMTISSMAAISTMVAFVVFSWVRFQLDPERFNPV